MMEVFRTYDCNLPRVRLGEIDDGGYVISEGLQYDLLVSGGICDSLCFEDDFVKRYQVPCYAHDHTIDQVPPHTEKHLIQVFKKMISGKTSEKSTNLTEYLTANKRVFVKMDIEGSEWEWLDSLEARHMQAIQQMVIEFHLTMEITDQTKDLFFNRLRIIEKLNRTHLLMHIHANNYANAFMLDGVDYPRVLECTYVNKFALMHIPKILVTLNMRCFPTALDAPNSDQRDDLSDALNIEPFRYNELRMIE